MFKQKLSQILVHKTSIFENTFYKNSYYVIDIFGKFSKIRKNLSKIWYVFLL